MYLITFGILLLSLGAERCYSSFLELGDNFSELRKNGGYWLIKFYAPWCGHCQRLEPLWAEVGDALSKTNIRVGRIDCSRHASVASEFGIRGYPTIKFITSDSEFTFNGDRNKDDIIQFTTRVSGPPVHMISSSKDLSYIKSSNYICFIYVGDLKGDLWDIFYNISKKFRPYAHFYAISDHVAKEVESITVAPTIFVYKENRAYFFIADQSRDNDITKINSTLSRWINEERFYTFQKVTYGNLNDLIQLNKYIVLVVVDEKNLIENPDALNFKNMMEQLAKKKKEKYKNFIFGWIGNPELANSIALKKVPFPYLMVLNSTNHQYYVPDTKCIDMSIKDVEIFLDDVNNQLVPALGGNSFGVRLYRAYFETKTAIIEMWRGNPLLTSVLFAIPLLFISFIFYSICFAEILDTDEDDYDDEEEERENTHLKDE